MILIKLALFTVQHFQNALLNYSSATIENSCPSVHLSVHVCVCVCVCVRVRACVCVHDNSKNNGIQLKPEHIVVQSIPLNITCVVPGKNVILTGM